MNTAATGQPLGVAYILATGKKGCTYHFGEPFLAALGKHSALQVTRIVLPQDAPPYCTGCMACFTRGMEACPHSAKVQPIWQAMLAADPVLVAQPAYCVGTLGHLKATLDHLASRWLVHSPDPQMLNKRVMIISQAVGLGAKRAGKAVRSSMRFLGAAKVPMCSFTVMNTTLEHMPAGRKPAFTADLTGWRSGSALAPTT